MDTLKQLNDAVSYIEAHLCEEIDMGKLSRITLSTSNEFSRFFRYMTGMTLREYIRRRRLTSAAYELRASSISVLDTAVKYGYDSADAFRRTFIRQHGIGPSAARDLAAPLHVYPPVSFHITVKGAQKMNFTIKTTGEIRLAGITGRMTGAPADRWEQEHVFWATECENLPEKISNTIPGVWYGIWNGGLYGVAKKEGEVSFDRLEQVLIPAGTYAVFHTEYGGFAGDELPKLRGLIFDSWLQDSGYVQASDFEVEVYHLYPKNEKHRRHYELWIPVVSALHAKSRSDFI